MSNSNKPKQYIVKFPHKWLRSKVIDQYVKHAGYKGTVIFSCGNAAANLRTVMQGSVPGTQHVTNKPMIVEVGPKGDLSTSKWWTPEGIHQVWPDLFDATPGHLPMPLMARIAEEFKDYLSHDSQLKINDQNEYLVPTGSGETIICLRLAFPNAKFTAIYDNNELATSYEPEAPLASAVEALFPVRIIEKNTVAV